MKTRNYPKKDPINRQPKIREHAGEIHPSHELEGTISAYDQQAHQFPTTLYTLNDQNAFQFASPWAATYVQSLKSIDELLERDVLREKDGFPRKIKIGRLISPSRGGKEKIVVVPTTVEEKFYHDSRPGGSAEEGTSSGSGDGDEGEVIGEESLQNKKGQGQGGSGEGGEEGHEIESNAYDLGRILTEKFELPNLQDKGSRRSLTKYTYDLTDRNKGVGQILDKKATLKKIIDTNMNLENIPDIGNIDPSDLLVSPRDMIYRILSREKDYESQAMVFFVRDYSGSMAGKPTEAIVSQHVMIYSWLLYQYDRMVETRFILHDTQAKEVKDFYTYYNSMIAGGTKVGSAFKLVSEIVESENLARDYNIYIFYGTDGDDWDTDGKETIPELKKMLTFSNRIGLTIAKNTIESSTLTTVEKYINDSKLLEEYPKQLRMDALANGADENRLIEGIKKLTS
jgi:uncharacterized sporulation protein YeaH/YhbH (DUF444 family)